MLLISQFDGDAAVPFATMKRATELSDGRWRVLDANGDVHHFSAADWDLAMRSTPASTWPAAPGTYLISVEFEGHRHKVWRNNVLAWMLAFDRKVRPIITDPEGLPTTWTVQHPDGRIDDSEGSSWKNVSDWIEINRPKG